MAKIAVDVHVDQPGQHITAAGVNPLRLRGHIPRIHSAMDVSVKQQRPALHNPLRQHDLSIYNGLHLRSLLLFGILRPWWARTISLGRRCGRPPKGASRASAGTDGKAMYRENLRPHDDPGKAQLSRTGQQIARFPRRRPLARFSGNVKTAPPRKGIRSPLRLRRRQCAFHKSFLQCSEAPVYRAVFAIGALGQG